MSEYILPWIPLLAIGVTIFLAMLGYYLKGKAILPLFQVKFSNAYGEHFNFCIHNNGEKPINIYKVVYPNDIETDQTQFSDEEFGAVILQKITKEKPINIEVYYKLNNNKTKRTDIELIRDGQKIYIQNQSHK